MPVVLVETVGVGQQEVAVAAATDTTVVVVNPGWGDAIQANKAGLLEIADLFVINKADRPGARETRRDLELMLDLTELGGWRPPIVETVASTGDGVDDLWDAIGGHRDHQIDRGHPGASSAAGGSSASSTRSSRPGWRADRRRAAAGPRRPPASPRPCWPATLDPYEAADRLLAAPRAVPVTDPLTEA